MTTIKDLMINGIISTTLIKTSEGQQTLLLMLLAYIVVIGTGAGWLDVQPLVIASVLAAAGINGHGFNNSRGMVKAAKANKEEPKQ